MKPWLPTSGAGAPDADIADRDALEADLADPMEAKVVGRLALKMIAPAGASGAG